MLDIADFMQTVDARGVVNILAADKLLQSPRLYATFLLWMLSELFEALPEVGDLDKPKLVFFFDEAHLLFKDAPTVLVERIELVVRLVRSKGVGVYFVTQNPADLPDSVLAQLGNRVQHALRAFTPRDQKAVRAAAQTMRANPALDIETAITELAVGEALVSLLDEHGRPGVTQRVFVQPPGSRLGPITPQQRSALMQGSLVAGVYEQAVDRDSAYEQLRARVPTAAGPAGAEAGGGMLDGLKDLLFGSTGPRGGRREGLAEAAARSAMRTVGSTVGREIVRGVLGSLLGGTRRRRCAVHAPARGPSGGWRVSACEGPGSAAPVMVVARPGRDDHGRNIDHRRRDVARRGRHVHRRHGRPVHGRRRRVVDGRRRHVGRRPRHVQRRRRHIDRRRRRIAHAGRRHVHRRRAHRRVGNHGTYCHTGAERVDADGPLHIGRPGRHRELAPQGQHGGAKNKRGALHNGVLRGDVLQQRAAGRPGARANCVGLQVPPLYRISGRTRICTGRRPLYLPPCPHPKPPSRATSCAPSSNATWPLVPTPRVIGPAAPATPRTRAAAPWTRHASAPVSRPSPTATCTWATPRASA
jgi:hypothetical protein